MACDAIGTRTTTALRRHGYACRAIVPGRSGIPVALLAAAALSTVQAGSPGEFRADGPGGGAVTAAGAAPHPRAIAQPPRLGAHTLYWQAQHHGVDPALTQPIATQARGSSFVVFNAGYSQNANAPTDSWSNAWVRLGDPVVFRGYGGQYDIKAYVAVDGVGGNEHTVRIAKTAAASGEITIPFIEVRDAQVLQSFVHNYPAAAPSLLRTVLDALSPFGGQSPVAGPRGVRRLDDPFRVALTSGSVTTTGPATLVAVWFGDGYFFDMTTVPDNGFTVIDSLLHLPPDSAVQCAVAYRDVAEAGTYNVTWTQRPNQGAALWLFAFQSGTPGPDADGRRSVHDTRRSRP